MISFRLRVKMFTSLECSTTGLPIPTTQLKDLWWRIKKVSWNSKFTSSKISSQNLIWFLGYFRTKLAEWSETRVFDLNRAFCSKSSVFVNNHFFRNRVFSPKSRIFDCKFASEIIFFRSKTCIFDRNWFFSNSKIGLCCNNNIFSSKTAECRKFVDDSKLFGETQIFCSKSSIP